MVFLNLHVEFGLKHTTVLQLSYGVFWIERIEVVNTYKTKRLLGNDTIYSRRVMEPLEAVISI
jgi:hypothetical protein